MLKMSCLRSILLTFLLGFSFAARADDLVHIYWPLHDGDITHFSGTNGKTDLHMVLDNSHAFPRFSEEIYYSTNAAPVTNLGGATSFALSNSVLISFGATGPTNTLTFSPVWSVLNNALLTAPGTLSSTFTATVNTTNFIINAVTTTKPLGNVTVPAGLFRDCWSVQYTLTYIAKQVLVQQYVVAPHVGIIQIGIYNTNFVLLGRESLTGGTIGGQDVSAFTNFALLRFVKKPVAQTVLFGGTAKFTATASGNEPLTYQWTKDSVVLTDDGRISGSLTTNLTIAAVQNADAGSYAMIVADQFSSITSSSAGLTLKPDITVPTVAITAPVLNARTNGTAISGTASDNTRLAHVYYWFTNINHGVITVSATNEAALSGTNVMKLNWNANAAPLPGTNILVVQAQDFQGNNSLTVSRAFFYKVPSLFTLTKSGDGNGGFSGKAAVAGDAVPTNSVMLNIGEGYAITGFPDTNSFLTNWTGSLGLVSTNTINFIMEPDFALQANFVTNLFIHMAGTYNGLFMVNNSLNDARLESAGMMSSLAVSRLGVYSGKLLLGGLPYVVSGKFNMGGQSTNVIARTAAAGGPLTLTMTLDWFNDHRIIEGNVSGTNGGAWVAPLLMIINSAATNSLSYTLSVPPTNNSPDGTGGLLLTNKAGVITLNGLLADGAAPAQTVSIDETLSVPIYSSLYANSGLLIGWLDVNREDSTGDHVPAGNLMWLKKSSHTSLLYTNGFTNVVTVAGSVWIMPPQGVAALPMTTNNPGVLSLSGGALSNAIAFNIAVTTNNVITKVSGATNSLAGTIDPKTGLVKITFGNGVGKATTAAQGVIQQIATNAAGAFLGKTNSGGFSITPVIPIP